MDKFYLWLIIPALIGVIALATLLLMHTHDLKVVTDNWLKDTDCSYLKNFISEEEPKYFKHPFYNGAVKKVNSVECIEEAKP